MKTVAEYITARGRNANSLDVSVNDLLRLGYQPYGHPYMSEGEEYFLCQPMIRCEETMESEPKPIEKPELAMAA
jgi:hypothetical protein